MNNFEKIKQMSVDEMAELLGKIAAKHAINPFEYTPIELEQIYDNYVEKYRKYLLQEVEE